MTQHQVSRLTGLTPSYLSRLENGRIVPSIATLTRLAEAFELGLDAFFQPGTMLEAGDRCPVSLCGECILDLSFHSGGRRVEKSKETYTSEHLEILRLCNRILHAGDARIREGFITMVRAMGRAVGIPDGGESTTS